MVYDYPTFSGRHFQGVITGDGITSETFEMRTYTEKDKPELSTQGQYLAEASVVTTSGLTFYGIPPRSEVRIVFTIDSLMPGVLVSRAEMKSFGSSVGRKHSVRSAASLIRDIFPPMAPHDPAAGAEISYSCPAGTSPVSAEQDDTRVRVSWADKRAGIALVSSVGNTTFGLPTLQTCKISRQQKARFHYDKRLFVDCSTSLTIVLNEKTTNILIMTEGVE